MLFDSISYKRNIYLNVGIHFISIYFIIIHDRLVRTSELYMKQKIIKLHRLEMCCHKTAINHIFYFSDRRTILFYSSLSINIFSLVQQKICLFFIYFIFRACVILKMWNNKKFVQMFQKCCCSLPFYFISRC